MSELRNLKNRIEELESEIRERDEEVRVLKESAQQRLINGDDTDSAKVIFCFSMQTTIKILLFEEHYYANGWVFKCYKQIASISPCFFQNLQAENDNLKKTLEKVQSQLETSLDAQDQQRKVLDAINRQFGDHLHALGELQNELAAALNPWS